MKLSKRGLRSMLICWSLLLFLVGFIALIMSLPQVIGTTIGIVVGLIVVTISGYKIGKPVLSKDDPKLEISFRKIFRRRG